MVNSIQNQINHTRWGAARRRLLCMGYHLEVRFSTAQLNQSAARIWKKHMQYLQSWSWYKVLMAAFKCHNMRLSVNNTSHQIHILYHSQIQTDQNALQSEKKTQGEVVKKFFSRWSRWARKPHKGIWNIGIISEI